MRKIKVNNTGDSLLCENYSKSRTDLRKKSEAKGTSLLTIYGNGMISRLSI